MLQQADERGFHYFLSLLNMSQFATAKHNGHHHFILVLKERDGLFDFEINVVRTRLRSQAYLFELGRVRLVFVGALVLFVFEFAEVHDSADRGFGIRGD